MSVCAFCSRTRNSCMVINNTWSHTQRLAIKLLQQFSCASLPSLKRGGATDTINSVCIAWWAKCNTLLLENVPFLHLTPESLKFEQDAMQLSGTMTSLWLYLGNEKVLIAAQQYDLCLHIYMLFLWQHFNYHQPTHTSPHLSLGIDSKLSRMQQLQL